MVGNWNALKEEAVEANSIHNKQKYNENVNIEKGKISTSGINS